MKKFLFLTLALSLVLGCEKDANNSKFTDFDFTKENFINGYSVKTLERDGITVSFGCPATWYKDDQGLHVPAGVTFALSSDKTIEKVVFTFGNSDKDNTIKAFEGEISDNVWTGAVKKVFFNIEGTSGYRCISRISVKLGNKESYNMTDVIDAAFTGVSSTSLESWSDKKGTASQATYRGKTATEDGVIVLNKEKGGIISNRSGGFVRHIEIKWNKTLIFPIDLLVYGDNSYYTEPSDLYSSSYAGTLLGTVSCGSSRNTIIDVKGNYKYVGVRQKPDDNMDDSWNKLYIDKVEVTWE